MSRILNLEFVILPLDYIDNAITSAIRLLDLLLFASNDLCDPVASRND